MEYAVMKFDTVVQLIFQQTNSYDDYETINKKIESLPGVKKTKEIMTFETPITSYKYDGIEFSLLFDEMSDETFVAIPTPQDPKPIMELVEKQLN